jgi:leucyl/phenylalanyl-tRNA--protein transferase
MELEPATLLSAYSQGVFPMADRDGVLRFYTADPRGLVPIDERFHVPHTLGQLMRKSPPVFQVRINCDFEATMRACRDCRADGTWINEEIIDAYCRLHELGFAHSVETWQNGAMVGGLYGVSLGAAFFGESMFHTVTDASKVALVHLVQRLRERTFELLDSQATTAHLRKFGAYDIAAHAYIVLLNKALKRKCEFG